MLTLFSINDFIFIARLNNQFPVTGSLPDDSEEQTQVEGPLEVAHSREAVLVSDLRRTLLQRDQVHRSRSETGRSHW